jgi:PIN domain nuclease of toxin-antitoxin system
VSLHLENGHILFIAIGLSVLMIAAAGFIASEIMHKWRHSKWAMDATQRMNARHARIAMRFIDRANDVAPESGDPAERILAEWAAETNAAMSIGDER